MRLIVIIRVIGETGWVELFFPFFFKGAIAVSYVIRYALSLQNAVPSGHGSCWTTALYAAVVDAQSVTGNSRADFGQMYYWPAPCLHGHSFLASAKNHLAD